MTGAAAAVLWGLLAFGGPSLLPEAHPDSLRGPGNAVPFVAQTPLLCGGAAAAMVERYWGARGVYGEDFRHLVREAEGGIRTSELASALSRKGYRVRAFRRNPGAVFAALDAGIPPILLLEGGLPELHYVVLVGLNEREAWIHDPNSGPARRLSREELLRRWGPSNHWALLVAPDPSLTEDAPDPRVTSGGPEKGRSSPGPKAATPATPLVESAMAHLRKGDHAGARAAARDLVRQGGGEGRLGRRVLATAHFLEGETGRALDHWNALGEPGIDLVRITGLEAIRYHAAAGRMALRHEEVLTRSSLTLARRRLGALPGVRASRIDYRPLPDGKAEVRASVLERSPWPTPLGLSTQAVGGLLHGEAELEFGPLLSAGDRWTLGGSWAPAQRHALASLSTPASPLPGIVTLKMEWRRERFGPAAPRSPDVSVEVASQERLAASLELREWVGAHTRVGGLLGLERWDALDRMAMAGVSAGRMFRDDQGWISVVAEGWTGSARSFGRLSVRAGLDLPRGQHRAWRVRAGGVTTSANAPRMIWPGAGTGRIRGPLLRAHPLADSGAINGLAFGPGLVNATAEHRVFARLGPVRVGGAIFVDAARVWYGGAETGTRTLTDVGTSVFVGPEDREVAASLAHGESGWVLSVRVGRWP